MKVAEQNGFESRSVEDVFGQEIFSIAQAHGYLRTRHTKYKYAKLNGEVNHSTNNCRMKKATLRYDEGQVPNFGMQYQDLLDFTVQDAVCRGASSRRNHLRHLGYFCPEEDQGYIDLLTDRSRTRPQPTRKARYSKTRESENIGRTHGRGLRHCRTSYGEVLVLCCSSSATVLFATGAVSSRCVPVAGQLGALLCLS